MVSGVRFRKRINQPPSPHLSENPFLRNLRGKGFLPRTPLESVNLRGKRGMVSEKNKPASYPAPFRKPIVWNLRGEGFLPRTALESIDLRGKRGKVSNANKPTSYPAPFLALFLTPALALAESGQAQGQDQGQDQGQRLGQGREGCGVRGRLLLF